MIKDKKLNSLLWVEKYRPKTFEDMVGLDERIPKLVNQNMPHLLFVSPPGTGKTTASKIIIDKLGCDSLVLNASDERGIDTIREKVKTFSMTLSSKKDIFKVVLLDEGDYLTPEAQAILRNLLETYAKNCRFIITCNFENRIIDAIQSRCSKFTFKKVSDDELLSLLEKICKNENVQYDVNSLKKIIEVSRGDIRKSINLLQQNIKDNKVIPDVILESNVKDILDKLKQGKFDDVRRELIEKGVDYEQLIVEIFRYVSSNKEFSLEIRKKIILEIAQTLYEMSFVLIKEIPFAKFMIRVEEVLK
jgi:replication factor C small subunit